MFLFRWMVAIGVKLSWKNPIKLHIVEANERGQVQFTFTGPMGDSYVWLFEADKARDFGWDIIRIADKAEDAQLSEDAADLRW